MSILPDGSPLRENPAWDDPEGHGDGSSPLSDALAELRVLIETRPSSSDSPGHWSASAARWAYYYADVIVDAASSPPETDRQA